MTVRKAQHDYLLPASEWFVNNEHFAGAASSTITVPAGYTAVYFSSTVDFWLAPGAAAAIPAGDITNGTSPFRNPAGLKELGSLPGGQFTIVTGAAGEVAMFFARAVQS